MVAPIDVNKFIQEKIREHSTHTTEGIEKHIYEVMEALHLSVDEFVRDYILEMHPTTLEHAHGGIVGMDLDMRPDTSTVKFVTHYRIRRKTDAEKEADDTRE